MRKNHLSFIFYFVINIVIFTSRADGDESWPRYIDESQESVNVRKLISTRPERHKFHPDSFANHVSETHNNDVGGGLGSPSSKFSGDSDAKFRYTLRRMQTRDVNGQTAASAGGASGAGKPTSDTFNATASTTINKSDSDLSKTFINNTFDERPAAAGGVTNTKTAELANVLSVLDQMREELELLRMAKQCNGTPDGSNCDVNGAWNSEQIGLRLELATSLTDDKLAVKLSDKAPKRATTYKIDASWSCSGAVLHAIGGPFYFFCKKPPLDSIAIFQGVCKMCSGFETVFGQWHFQHNPKDCRQLFTFVESKNDIFRKDVLHRLQAQQRGHDGNANVTVTPIPTEKSPVTGKKHKSRRHIRSNHHKLMQATNQEFY